LVDQKNQHRLLLSLPGGAPRTPAEDARPEANQVKQRHGDVMQINGYVEMLFFVMQTSLKTNELFKTASTKAVACRPNSKWMS